MTLLSLKELKEICKTVKIPIVAIGGITIQNAGQLTGIGSMLRAKINVNLGVSRDCKDYNIEMEKVMSAVRLGAEAIMDLSSHGDMQPFRRKLTKDFLEVVWLHAEDGVDFVTLHCGITKKPLSRSENTNEK